MKLYNIQNINELENSINVGLIKLEKYNLPNTYSFAIGRVHIKSWMDNVIINIDETVSKSYMSEWYTSIGKLFIRDLESKSLNNYFYTCYNNVYYLFKLISDDDKTYLKKKNIKEYEFIVVNDNIYAIICVSLSDKYMTSDFTLSYKNTEIQDDSIDEIVDNDRVEYDSLELFNDDIFENDWDE